MTGPERVMSIMKYAFVVSVLLFIFVTIQVPSKTAHPPQRSFELIIVMLALINVALGLSARRFWGRLTQANASRTGNTPLGQWFSANVFTLAMIESCALFAVVLHMLGSPSKLAGILFGCALLALLAWNPGRPPTPEDPSGISR